MISTNEPGCNGEIPSADMGEGMQDNTDHSEDMLHALPRLT